RHTRCLSDWSSDVCSSDLGFVARLAGVQAHFLPVRDDRTAALMLSAVAPAEDGDALALLHQQAAERLRHRCFARAASRQVADAEIGRASCRERVWGSV